MEHLTAKISCFARAYHVQANPRPVFADTAAQALLGRAYDQIAQSLTEGVPFFLPGFQGPPEEGLRQVVEDHLAPGVLGRSAFCEAALADARRRGCRQYVLFAAGYDTFALRDTDQGLDIFELDRPALLAEKAADVERAGLKSRAISVPCDLAGPQWPQALLAAGYRREEMAFGSLLGLSYYLDKEAMCALMEAIGQIMSPGSWLCLDYPETQYAQTGGLTAALARSAGEPMRSRYAPEEIEGLLARGGFQVRKHLHRREMTDRFFSLCDPSRPAPEGVGYLLAVKG